MNQDNKDTEQTLTQETPQEEMPNTLQNDMPEKSTSGPLIGVAIIIIMLVAGGIYFWSTTIDRVEEENKSSAPESMTDVDTIVNQLSTQGTSDEIADIEADLNTTELDNLDSELDSLLNEL